MLLNRFLANILYMLSCILRLYKGANVSVLRIPLFKRNSTPDTQKSSCKFQPSIYVSYIQDSLILQKLSLDYMPFILGLQKGVNEKILHCTQAGVQCISTRSLILSFIRHTKLSMTSCIIHAPMQYHPLYAIQTGLDIGHFYRKKLSIG